MNFIDRVLRAQKSSGKKSIKLARFTPCFLKHEFVRAFRRFQMQRTRLFSSFARSGHKKQSPLMRAIGVLEYALLGLSFSTS